MAKQTEFSGKYSRHRVKEPSEDETIRMVLNYRIVARPKNKPAVWQAPNGELVVHHEALKRAQLLLSAAGHPGTKVVK